MGRTDSKAVFWSDQIGYQYTIANLTAALALAQVQRIEELLKIKRNIHSVYKSRLVSYSEFIMLIDNAHQCESNFCYPSILLKDTVSVKRDEILSTFREKNIHARPAFPRMSLFPVFEARFPNLIATNVQERGITLPAAANLNDDDINFVCDTLIDIISK